MPTEITGANFGGLTGFEADALKEVANIGSGNASMALSAIFGKKVNISVPEMQIVQSSKMAKSMSNDNIVIGICSRLKEGIDGNVFIFFPSTSAIKFVSILKKEPSEGKEVMTQEDEALLKKITSVIYSAYITSIAKFFEQRIVFSEPELISNAGSSIIDSILVRIDKKENLVVIKVDFEIDAEMINGDFTLALTVSSLAPLLGKLKQKFNIVR
ncbi:MAG: chemotaxis protein CheC [archaeon]